MYYPALSKNLTLCFELQPCRTTALDSVWGSSVGPYGTICSLRLHCSVESQQSEDHMFIGATYTILTPSLPFYLPRQLRAAEIALIWCVKGVYYRRMFINRPACLRRRRRPLHRLYYGPHERSFTPQPLQPPPQSPPAPLSGRRRLWQLF